MITVSMTQAIDLRQVRFSLTKRKEIEPNEVIMALESEATGRNRTSGSSFLERIDTLFQRTYGSQILFSADTQHFLRNLKISALRSPLLGRTPNLSGRPYPSCRFWHLESTHWVAKLRANVEQTIDL